MIDAWVALGASVEPRQATLTRALEQLARVPGIVVERVSSLYESPAELPAGRDGPAPPFLNAVAGLRTALAPRALLWHLLRIEAGLGRRRHVRSIERTIDLDLLAAGDAVIHEPDLVLPHPRLAARAFVVGPLLEIAPGWRLPGGGPLVSSLDSPSLDSPSLIGPSFAGASSDPAACVRIARWTGQEWEALP